MTRDLTTGSPMRLILGFGLPLLLGNLFQQLYNVVDSAIVGKTLGAGALAAVGATGSVNFLIVGFCIGICSGFAIPVAHHFGAKDYKELRLTVTAAIRICIVFAAIITTATTVFCRDILRMMNTPADVFERSVSYIGTIFRALPAWFLYNLCAGILRSMGDSRTPVKCLIAASVTNICLDILFILVFKLDVFGAALATVISQSVAGLGCLIKLCRDFPMLKLSRSDWAWSWKRCGELCVMGLPMGLQFSITAIGSVTLQTAVNGLGTDAVAAVTAANKVCMFLVCPFDALGATMATWSGQHVGARKFDRLIKGLRSCILLGAMWAVMAFGVILLFGEHMAMLFLDEKSRHLLPMCRRFFLTNGAFYIPLSLVHIFRLSIQGMGYSPLATMAGVMELFARVFVAGLVSTFGFAAVCFASPAAWVLADVFLIPAYFFCVRRLKNPRGGFEHRRKAHSVS